MIKAWHVAISLIRETQVILTQMMHQGMPGMRPVKLLTVGWLQGPPVQDSHPWE